MTTSIRVIRHGRDADLTDLMTVTEAAALLGMRAGSVRAAIRRGRLPAVRLGNRLLVVDRDDVEAYRHTSRRGVPR